MNYNGRLIIVGFFVLFFNSQVPAFPISYTRLIHPETGQCIDLISDIHISMSKDDLQFATHDQLDKCAQYQEGLLESLKYLAQHAKEPINLIWEYSNDGSKDGDSELFINHAYTAMQDHLTETSKITLINGETRTYVLNAFSDILYCLSKYTVGKHDDIAFTIKQYCKKLEVPVTVADLFKEFAHVSNLIEKIKTSYPEMYRGIKAEWFNLQDELLQSEIIKGFDFKKNKTFSLEDFALFLLRHIQYRSGQDRANFISSCATVEDILMTSYADFGFMGNILSTTKHTIVYAGHQHTSIISQQFQEFGFVPYMSKCHKRLDSANIGTEIDRLKQSRFSANGNPYYPLETLEIADFVYKKNIYKAPWNTNIWKQALIEAPATSYDAMRKKLANKEMIMNVL